ncbi:MAG: NADH-quinone oxidoreductase subunit C [Candidatus Binatia bacterium]|nr:NADH-quinone oxidoreductase subunit C [Candidatus Binatia bacterium]
MDATEIHRRLRERHGNSVLPEVAEAEWAIVEVLPAAVAEACRHLKEDPEIAFDCLSNLTAVDRKADDLIDVYYHLYSYEHRHKLTLKASCPRLDPVLPTVSTVWPIGDWLEREAFDLMGVNFIGHGDLRRLLMPEDWVGHPLRKDFVEPEEYHGISTRRESLLKL